VRIERLARKGHELRRPENGFLRDGLYELRTKHRRENYRILYFFHGRDTAVLVGGLVKQRARVPEREIDRALRRKQAFVANPQRHTYEE
jgi:phage-related protein